MDEAPVDEVREGAVAQVVAQARQVHAELVRVRDGQLRLALPQLPHEAAREVRHAERVLEAFARRACEDVINTAQLAQVSEPLELRRVHDQYCRGVQLDVVMDGVLDDLHGGSIVVSREFRREADDRQ